MKSVTLQITQFSCLKSGKLRSFYFILEGLAYRMLFYAKTKFYFIISAHNNYLYNLVIKFQQYAQEVFFYSSWLRLLLTVLSLLISEVDFSRAGSKVVFFVSTLVVNAIWFW